MGSEMCIRDRGENARRAVAERLGMSAVVDILEQNYRRAIFTREAVH